MDATLVATLTTPPTDGFEAELAAFDAHLYKIVPAASQSGEEIPALLLLDSLKRRDVAAFSVGPVGAWMRLVAPRLGAPVIYGALGDVPGAPGHGVRHLLLIPEGGEECSTCAP